MKITPMVVAASTAETKTAIDVSTITTEDLKRWVETVVQLKDLISSPPLVSELTQILTANHEAMSVITALIRPLGFVPAEEHVEARLPPLLEAFKILNEEDQLVSFLKDPSFLEAQQSVQQTPNDSGVLTALQQFTSKVTEMYDSAIQKRLQEDNIKITCRKVVLAGNEDFLGVYKNMWQMIMKSDHEGCKQIQTALAALRLPEKATTQTTSDPTTLYQHAAMIQSTFQTFVSEIAQTVDGVEVSVPSSLKKMGRIVEKTILKRKDDSGNADKVCDVVRGMILCDNLQQIAAIIDYLRARQDVIILSRIKDRFFDQPSAGGWRDCMINFSFVSDVTNQHICELQLVHNQMMTARKGLPGHAVYNRVRNASELLGMFPAEQPQNKQELQEWLFQYHAKGDKFTRGSPNLWDTSKITDMSKLFVGAEDFNEPIGRWDTSHVKTMESMFTGAKEFNQPIGDWDMANVEDVSGMFRVATSFNQPIGNWNMSNVKNMANMFGGAQQFNQPIGEWDTSKVEYMLMMFNEASNFNQPIGEWNTSNVVSMRSMFFEASNFNQPIGNWNMSEVENISGMFRAAAAFNQPIGDWDTAKVKFMQMMFKDATCFNQPIGEWNTSKVEDMASMFEDATSFNQPIMQWDTSMVEYMHLMFFGATTFNQPIQVWDTSSVDSMSRMLSGATAFNQRIPEEWETRGALVPALDTEAEVTGSKADIKSLMCDDY